MAEDAIFQAAIDLAQAQHDLATGVPAGALWKKAMADLMAACADHAAYHDGYMPVPEIEDMMVITRAVRQYANRRLLHQPSAIQSDLLAILGRQHNHQPSISSCECALCFRDVADSVHMHGDGERSGTEGKFYGW